MSFVTTVPETRQSVPCMASAGSRVGGSTFSQKVLVCTRSHNRFCRGVGRVDSRRHHLPNRCFT